MDFGRWHVLCFFEKGIRTRTERSSPEMSSSISRILATVAFGALIAASAQAQLLRPPEPLPPPLPDEIRPTIVRAAPPRLRVERRELRPGPDSVWAPGYWDWAGRDWAWIPGRWALAPTAGARWVPARYVRLERGWRYIPAHWTSQRVVAVGEVGRGQGRGHAKARGKGHWKRKGRGHRKD
jgi:hypothetical protein